LDLITSRLIDYISVMSSKIMLWVPENTLFGLL